MGGWVGGRRSPARSTGTYQTSLQPTDACQHLTCLLHVSHDAGKGFGHLGEACIADRRGTGAFGGRQGAATSYGQHTSSTASSPARGSPFTRMSPVMTPPVLRPASTSCGRRQVLGVMGGWHGLGAGLAGTSSNPTADLCLQPTLSPSEWSCRHQMRP